MRETIFAVLFAVLVVVSVVQAVTVMSLNEKLDSVSGSVAVKKSTGIQTSQNTQPSKTQGKSLGDLAGMVGGC